MGRRQKNQENYHLNDDVIALPERLDEIVTSNSSSAMLKSVIDRVTVPSVTKPEWFNTNYADTIDKYVEVTSPLMQMWNNTGSVRTPREESDAAWLDAFRVMPPDILRRAIQAAIEEPDRQLRDNGTDYVLMKAEDLREVLALIKVFEKHGAPQTQRYELSRQEYQRVVEQTIRLVDGEQGRLMPDSLRLPTRSGSQRYVNEAVAIALNALNMLPRE